MPKQIAKKYLSREQADRLHGLVRIKGHNTVSLAAELGQPWSTVAGVMNGSKRTPAVRAGIAAFLEMSEAELFGGNGKDHRLEACATETPPPLEPPAPRVDSMVVRFRKRFFKKPEVKVHD